MEDGFDEDVIGGLEKRGHKLREYPEVGTPGAVQLIHINHETGVHTGGTDGRCDGFPIPE
jgi:gamma-glutamyltranspeptidase